MLRRINVRRIIFRFGDICALSNIPYCCRPIRDSTISYDVADEAVVAVAARVGGRQDVRFVPIGQWRASGKAMCSCWTPCCWIVAAPTRASYPYYPI